jgi:hypothetical protein
MMKGMLETVEIRCLETVSRYRLIEQRCNEDVRGRSLTNSELKIIK